MDARQQCIEAYRRLKNLKLVGEEVGIPWQTVYVHLRAVGEPVSGDKLRYGSDTDRFAAKAEQIFQGLVPHAKSQNEKKFQSKVDFLVGGYSVDVKASRYRNDRWAFSLKKQERVADFFVCFAFADDDSYRVIVIPGEVCRMFQTLSLSGRCPTKWWDYEVEADRLNDFFVEVEQADAERAA